MTSFNEPRSTTSVTTEKRIQIAPEEVRPSTASSQKTLVRYPRNDDFYRTIE
jgi:hypothetical protein